MKRLIALALLLLACFYVAWPAWSGYQIYQSIQARNSGLMDSKIDFPSVRKSLRPVITAKIGEGLEKFQAQAGAAGALISQLKGEMVPKLVDSTLATMVNSETVMRVATEGGSFKETLEKIMREQMGRSGLPAGGGAGGGLGQGLPGGLGGVLSGGAGGLGDLLGKVGRPKSSSPVRDITAEEASKPAAPADVGAAKPPAKFSLANIKTFRLSSPLSYVVGVAKNPEAPEADVTAEISFTGGDWKVTGLVPKL
jgi:Protein of unknown function (DUF2939)